MATVAVNHTHKNQNTFQHLLCLITVFEHIPGVLLVWHKPSVPAQECSKCAIKHICTTVKITRLVRVHPLDCWDQIPVSCGYVWISSLGMGKDSRRMDRSREVWGKEES